MLAGGNQSGKTTAVIIESIWHAFGTHPYKKDIKVPNVGRVVTALPFEEGINQVLWPKFLEWLPHGQYQVRKNSAGAISRIDCANGSKMHIMSAKQDDIAFEAATIDWAAIDEPVRREIYNATKRGLLRANGCLWWSFTPLTEPWIHNDLWLPAFNGERLDVGAYVMTTWDNCEEDGGYLPKSAIEEWEAELTPEERDARIFGMYRHLSGRIYPQFSDKNIQEIEPEEKWPIWEGIDPHAAKPHAWMQVAIDPNGRLIIFNEIFEKIIISELAEKIVKKREIDTDNPFMDKRRVLGCVLDTPGKIGGWDGEDSPVDILKRHGISTIIPSKHGKKDEWIQTIQYLLDCGKIIVHPRCKRVIREFNSYRRSAKGDIVKEDDDMMDILGYIIMQNPKFKHKPKIISYAGAL